MFSGVFLRFRPRYPYFEKQSQRRNCEQKDSSFCAGQSLMQWLSFLMSTWLFLSLLIFVYIACTLVCVHVCVLWMYVWRSEDNLEELFFTCHSVCSGIKLIVSLAAGTLTSRHQPSSWPFTLFFETVSSLKLVSIDLASQPNYVGRHLWFVPLP